GRAEAVAAAIGAAGSGRHPLLYVTRDGKRFPVLVDSHLVFDEDAIVGVVFTARPVESEGEPPDVGAPRGRGGGRRARRRPAQARGGWGRARGGGGGGGVGGGGRGPTRGAGRPGGAPRGGRRG